MLLSQVGLSFFSSYTRAALRNLLADSRYAVEQIALYVSLGACGLTVVGRDCSCLTLQEREENVRLDVISCFTCLLKVLYHMIPDSIKSAISTTD